MQAASLRPFPVSHERVPTSTDKTFNVAVLHAPPNLPISNDAHPAVTPGLALIAAALTAAAARLAVENAQARLECKMNRGINDRHSQER